MNSWWPLVAPKISSWILMAPGAPWPLASVASGILSRMDGRTKFQKRSRSGDSRAISRSSSRSSSNCNSSSRRNNGTISNFVYKFGALPRHSSTLRLFIQLFGLQALADSRKESTNRCLVGWPPSLRLSIGPFPL